MQTHICNEVDVTSMPISHPTNCSNNNSTILPASQLVKLDRQNISRIEVGDWILAANPVIGDIDEWGEMTAPGNSIGHVCRRETMTSDDGHEYLAITVVYPPGIICVLDEKDTDEGLTTFFLMTPPLEEDQTDNCSNPNGHEGATSGTSYNESDIRMDPLNAYQIAVKDAYSDGDHSHIHNVHQAKTVGDSLFAFLMIELSDEKGCTNQETAWRLLETAKHDIDSAINAVLTMSL